MRNDHSIAGTTILQTTLEDADNYSTWKLLHLILDNNVFRYQKTYFKQIRGLAMGNRLSGTLAIICMDKFERNHIYNELEPKIYVRYVDIGTVVKTVSQAHSMLQHMNSKHNTIRFEIELPDNDGFLPILDTRMKINQNGTIERNYTPSQQTKVSRWTSTHTTRVQPRPQLYIMSYAEPTSAQQRNIHSRPLKQLKINWSEMAIQSPSLRPT